MLEKEESKEDQSRRKQRKWDMKIEGGRGEEEEERKKVHSSSVIVPGIRASEQKKKRQTVRGRDREQSHSLSTLLGLFVLPVRKPPLL